MVTVAISASAALHKPVQTAKGALQGAPGKDPAVTVCCTTDRQSSLEITSAGTFMGRHSPRGELWKYLRAKPAQTRVLLPGGVL
jgi:hypothetical protein